MCLIDILFCLKTSNNPQEFDNANRTAGHIEACTHSCSFFKRMKRLTDSSTDWLKRKSKERREDRPAGPVCDFSVAVAVEPLYGVRQVGAVVGAFLRRQFQLARKHHRLAERLVVFALERLHRQLHSVHDCKPHKPVIDRILRILRPVAAPGKLL